MKIIHQGKPGRKYFIIARPYPADSKEVKRGEQVLLRHPRTKKECTARVSDQHWWVFLWADVPDSFAMLNFGMDAASLRKQLESSHLEFKNSEQVKFLMVEETNNQ